MVVTRTKTGTRFARTGRCRFCVCLLALVLMFGMVAIFHSSQQQLDDSRERRLRCEQQQDGLNERLQSVVEQKSVLEKNTEQERNEQMEARRSLEQNLREETQKLQESRQIYEKLQSTYKLLHSDHKQFTSECERNTKQLQEEKAELQQRLKMEHEEGEQAKNLLNGELSLLRKKYEEVVREKQQLKLQLKTVDVRADVAEGNNRLSSQQQISKPLHESDKISASSSPQPLKSFSGQVPVSPGLYHIGIKLTNNTKYYKSKAESATNNGGAGGGEGRDVALPLQIKAEPELESFAMRNNRSLILNSVENFQIVPKPMAKIVDGSVSVAAEAVAGDKMVSPLSAPRKSSSTKATETNAAEDAAGAGGSQHKQVSNASTSTASSHHSKLPENVAPIPAGIEQLLRNDAPVAMVASAQKSANAKAARSIGDIGDGVEGAEFGPSKENAKNNRYANAVNDMVQRDGAAQAGADLAGNEDSDFKDQDLLNPQMINEPADDDNNFFDGGGGGKHDDAGADNEGDLVKRHDNMEDNEDEDMIGGGGAGDIAVKNHNHMLDDNLNNEVAADQGKEFADGIHLDEGNNEDDEDEDDYSNPAVRQQGDKAVRH